MPIVRYGGTFPDGTTDATIELLCFHRAHSPEQGGLGRFEHLRNAIDAIWNVPRRRYAAERRIPYDPDKQDAFIWNEWTERMMRGQAENNEVTIAGPGASWKTTCLAMFKLCTWLSSPHNTRVILTSTTGDGLRARVWKELIHFYRAVGTIGNLVQSRTMIQWIKGDDGAGIFGIAVESDGDVDKAVNKIIGRHNTNMSIGVDEMPTVNKAIVEACVNLETGAERFEFCGVGNPDSRFDPHGTMAEPKDGWSSVSEDTDEWRTVRGGLCIHLDGRRSPRIGNDDKFPGLIRQQDIDRTADRYGENSPQMWKQRIGFWAPEGLTKTVLSETMILKFKAKEKAVWVGATKKGAGVDPAFEGSDRCILRIGRVGAIDGGKLAMTPGKPIQIKIDSTSKEPLHYQLSRQIHEYCAAEEVPKDMLAIDSTSEGDAVASILIRDYGYTVERIEFGGRPSTDQVSATNKKRADQEYLNRVTEIWYRFRMIVEAGQVRELDSETAVEFCNRRYELRGNLIQVEPKKEMKARANRSPDLADACCVLGMLFHKRKLLGNTGTAYSSNEVSEWRRIAKERDVISDPDAYLVAAE